VLACDQRITAWAGELKKAGLEGGMDELRARAFLDLVLGKDSRPRAPQAPDTTGTTGTTGATGATGPSSIGAPNSRSLSLATAYQCTDNTKPCIATVNVTSTANFSLTGGTTNSATVVLGSTNAVASGTGSTLGNYTNSVTGTIAVGLNLNSQSAQTYTIPVPAGWFFAVRQTAGTVSIVSAFDQALG